MIEIKNITKTFGSLEVLRGVSLTVEPKEIVAIVGPSGAGKTTLLQIMGTLERPNSGEVIYDGHNVFNLPDKKLAAFRNQQIGFVFQFHSLLPEFSLLENVALPALIAGKSKSEADKAAMELIDYMGLRLRASHKPAELSGGERQRAAVARALINKPKVILADEPSGSLDSHNRTELQKLFFNLRNDRGQSFVIVTHDEELAANADRTIRIIDGKKQ